MKRYSAKYNKQPNDYCITAYDAALVIADALGRVAQAGTPMTRAAMREIGNHVVPGARDAVFSQGVLDVFHESTL